MHTHKIADRRAGKNRSEICVIVTAAKLHRDHCRPQRWKNSKGLYPEKLFHHTSGFQRNKFGFLNIIWMFISDLAVRSDNSLYSFFNSSREAQYNKVRLPEVQLLVPFDTDMPRKRHFPCELFYILAWWHVENTIIGLFQGKQADRIFWSVPLFWSVP